MTDLPTSEADKTSQEDWAAYKAAQKKRNLYIGGALLVFVILVFALSIARLSEGMKHYKANHLSNMPAASTAQGDNGQ
jgi:hypothetical protein